MEDWHLEAGSSEPIQAALLQVQIVPAAQPSERLVVSEVRNLEQVEEESGEDSEHASHRRQRQSRSRA